MNCVLSIRLNEKRHHAKKIIIPNSGTLPEIDHQPITNYTKPPNKKRHVDYIVNTCVTLLL